MKILSATLLIFLSCLSVKKEGSVAYIILEHSFNDQRVEIYVDNKKIYDEFVTTDPSLSVADEHKITSIKGKHKLKVKVGKFEKTVVLNADELPEIYFGVRLYENWLIVHKYIKPPIYD